MADKKTDVVVEQSLKNELYVGPLPHPDILKGFKEIDADFPNRILSMTEKYAAADVYEQQKRARRNFIVPILGQIFTFLLGISGMAGGVLLALKGMEAGAVTAIVAGFSPILIQAIKSLKK
ncbi:MAG: hypothetical protein II811_04420 [Spirochaetaceae bacterium]|nr:hypothetical protein [Spirochaetaceae bacterium]